MLFPGVGGKMKSDLAIRGVKWPEKGKELGQIIHKKGRII